MANAPLKIVGSDFSNTSGISISSDVVWLRKALKRAKEQAINENKTLEEIATQRWGSLERFYCMLEEAEKKSSNKNPTHDNATHQNSYEHQIPKKNKIKHKRRSKNRDRTRSRSRDRTRSRSRDRKRSRNRDGKRSRNRDGKRSHIHKTCDTDTICMKNKMMCPGSDDEDNLYISKSDSKSQSFSGHRGWRKTKVVKEEIVLKRNSSPPCISGENKKTLSKEENIIVESEELLPPKVLTDQELNKLAAKLTKAELIGNDVLAQKLKDKLAASRLARKLTNVSNQANAHEEEEVLLMRSMPSGYTSFVSETDHRPAKRKGKMTAYFEEGRSLMQMFEHEKGISVEDHKEVAEEAVLQMGPTLEEDYDDIGGTADVVYKQIGRLQEKQRQRAILEHQNNEKSFECCNLCINNRHMQKHLVVSLGAKCYVALLPHEEMTNGQCVIVPNYHVKSSLFADEDVWQEIMDFRKALVNFYKSRDEDCIFFETYLRNKSRIPHMVIHCIPLPREIGDLSPIYFKKAIDECEGEWAQNKKLIDLKGKGVRNCLSKELSYFFVDFGNCPGYAHVIEDERNFTGKFAEEIVGGMLNVEAFLWLRPPKQSFDVQCKKVMRFAQDFKPFDHTMK